MKQNFLLLILLLAMPTFILTACGGSSVAQSASNQEPVSKQAEPAQAPAGDPAAGRELFIATCAACHGPAGQGVPGLGKDMTSSEFIAGLTDDELVEFIKIGRDPSDPLNTTGVAMPPKGGNPALSDQDLYNITAYIRSLQK